MTTVNNFTSTAWSIDGARHPGELLRAFAYAATAGREGVVISSDCKVTQLSTAGPQVGISPGAIAMRNRSAGAVNQSYVLFNRLNSFVDVAPTGGSPRSDLVITRPKDPQYSPWQSVVGQANPDTFQYVEPIVIQNVPATTTSAAQLNLGYSAYALARIDIPAGTTNITQTMIKDLRTLIQPAHDPKEARTVRVWQPPATILTIPGSREIRDWFPKTNESIFCPPWATRMTLIVSMNGLLFQGGMLRGNIQAEYGWNGDSSLLATQPVGFHYDSPYDIRQTLIAAQTFDVPVDFRNKAHFVRTGTVFHPTSNDAARIVQDDVTTIVVDCQFEETAD